MARSASLLILLATLVIQVVLACSGIEPGRYIIENEGSFLAVGPVLPVIPPRDVPARLFRRRFERPLLIETVQGGYTIRESDDYYSYGLVVKNGNEPYFSVEKKYPHTWSVSSAGDGFFTIGLANHDLLLTADSERGVTTLQPADGSQSQRWSLYGNERRRNLYRNRFQHIL